MPGFFSSTTSTKPIRASRIAKCGACGLSKRCKSPKMEPTGQGRLGVLVVAETPGETEDEEGVQLVGKSGQLLKKELAHCGVDLEKDCWKTNVVICKSGETSSEKCIDFCLPNLVKTIEKLKPRTIIPLGGVAVKALIGRYLGEDLGGGIIQWAGWKIPCQKLNTWICPTFHPSYILRSDNPVVDRMFQDHLEAAVLLEDRPWTTVPDWEQDVEVILDMDKAARILRKIIERGGMCAFDYETNMLKPDSSDARIASCAVCWKGKKTIAYPMHGPTIAATKEFLISSIPKVAANVKFEDRWSRASLNTRVNNWKWDTMTTAHTLDNRRGITGLKFQSFVMLGQGKYNADVEKYFQSRGANSPNRIGEVDMGVLLKYNGMDALLEYKLAEIQMEKMGYG